MTSAASPHPDLLQSAAAPRPSAGAARLWADLSRNRERQQPTQGADTIGEWAIGALRRFRARRLDWRRARSISLEGRRLASLSEAAFDDHLASAREAAILQRDDPRTIDAVLALTCAAISRHIGLTLHDQQILGAMAMTNGCCAELATGEGKTVTAILPAALDAFSGRGVHVITVNDYLARRDAEITSPAYRRLGLSIGIIQESSKPHERRAAYQASITYLADKQAIFDHLRDRLISPIWPRVAGVILDDLVGPGDRSPQGQPLALAESYRADWGSMVVQRGLHAAIIDEADSVLIDDAVTPAVISGSEMDADESSSHFQIAVQLAAEFESSRDYDVEPKVRRITLTAQGRTRLDNAAASLPPFWSGPRRREELIIQALSAREFYRLGEDYIIREGKIEIVDRSTGRVLPGRQWQLGVHQAIEAKEGLEVTRERHTSARVSYQDFFRRYHRLSGMTGTAAEVAGELWRWYRLPVVRVPTHKKIIRTHAADRVFATEQQKFDAVARRIQEFHAQDRPVLVGTRSINASEQLGAALRERSIQCDVLNAEREPEEAAIVARAGRPGAVTVATNMAGRGTDIQLDEKSRDAGGLAVIATERHDESRVDRQLFGRSGRQGDPGSAEAFVSLQDQLILQHGIRTLTWLVRAGGPLARPVAWLLWRGAQWSASRKWRILRGETAKIEAWQDMALHQRTR